MLLRFSTSLVFLTSVLFGCQSTSPKATNEQKNIIDSSNPSGETTAVEKSPEKVVEEGDATLTPAKDEKAKATSKAKGAKSTKAPKKK